jgi:hypothetical protein
MSKVMLISQEKLLKKKELETFVNDKKSFTRELEFSLI